MCPILVMGEDLVMVSAACQKATVKGVEIVITGN